jgi:hypothetical protein
MIPYDLDPSLHTGEPEPALLDDGFSPPQQDDEAQTAQTTRAPVDPALWTKSEF